MKLTYIVALALFIAVSTPAAAVEKGPLDNADFSQWFDGSRAGRLSTMIYWATALLEDELDSHTDEEIAVLSSLGVGCVKATYLKDKDAYFSPRILGVKCLSFYIHSAKS